MLQSYIKESSKPLERKCMQIIIDAIIQNKGNWESAEKLRGMLPPKLITEIKCKILYDFDWEEYHLMSENLEFYFFYLFNNSADDFKKKQLTTLYDQKNHLAVKFWPK